MLFKVLEIIGLFIIMLVGVLTHFLKKKITGQTTADIKLYFSSHLKDTIITVSAACIAFAVLITSGEYSILSAFAVGYIPDSFFNKTEEALSK